MAGALPHLRPELRISIGKLGECLKGVDPTQLRGMPEKLQALPLSSTFPQSAPASRAQHSALPSPRSLFHGSEVRCSLCSISVLRQLPDLPSLVDAADLPSMEVRAVSFLLEALSYQSHPCRKLDRQVVAGKIRGIQQEDRCSFHVMTSWTQCSFYSAFFGHVLMRRSPHQL